MLFRNSFIRFGSKFVNSQLRNATLRAPLVPMNSRYFSVSGGETSEDERSKVINPNAQSIVTMPQTKPVGAEPQEAGKKKPNRCKGDKDSFKINERGNYVVTLFRGDGIGPEISKAVMDVFLGANVPVDWDIHEIHSKAVTKEGDLISSTSIESILKNKVGLKGPFMTPIGKGHRSLNVTLRKKLQLYANVRPCLTIEGLRNLYDDVDVITIRENTEGEYSGLEHTVVPGVCESIKIMSKTACQNVSEFAFEYAKENNRKRVTACHKAGVMKMGDGLFLKTCREVAKNYPDIEYDEQQVDTVCLKLSMDPTTMDVMVMPNLYGDIVSDLCAGLIGGLGLTPSGNLGPNAAIFEAVHGTAPDIAGRNIANPTALLLSSVMMLRYMHMEDHADRIEKAILKVLGRGERLTLDLGGKATTTEYTQAIIDEIKHQTA